MAETDQEHQDPPRERVFLDIVLAFTPYVPKSNITRWPLEGGPRRGWRDQVVAKAIMWQLKWSLAYAWCGILSAVIAGVLHHFTGSWAGLWLLLSTVPCFVQIFRWSHRAGKHGVKWQERMFREAEERLAKTNPGRTW